MHPHSTELAPPTPAEHRVERWFLALILVYFAVHAVLRTALGGAYEMDEAEMVLLSRDLEWGYGPQLPAYNWLQWLFFQIFGVSTFAVAGLKNLCLAAIYVALYVSLRRAFPVAQAVMGTLSLLFLPHFLWDGQRASTHSTLMMLAIAGTLGSFFGAATQGRPRDYALLALWLALGALSKYNFWLFALPLWLAGLSVVPWRARLLSPRMLLSVLAVAVALAGPLIWAMTHPQLALSSTDKFYRDGDDWARYAWARGTLMLLGNAAIGLLIVGVVALVLRGRRVWRAGADAVPRTQDQAMLVMVCWRAFALASALTLASVVLSGATDVKGRWLLPVFLLIAPVLLADLSRHATRRRWRGVAIFAGVLCVAAWAGMADLRLRGAGSDSLRIDILAEQLAPDMAQGAVLATSYYYAGNLAHRQDDWRIVSTVDPLPDAPRYLVLATDSDEAYARRLLAERGQPGAAASYRLSRVDRLAVPYAEADARPRMLDLVVLEAP